MLAALSVIASLSMSFTFTIIPMTPDLDPSFVYSFNHAAAHGLKWGQDFISTYGPYGYLVSTMDLGHLVRTKVVFSLLLAVAAGIAVAAYVRSVPDLGPGTRVAMVFALIYAFSVQAPDYQWFALFVLLFLTGVLATGRAGLVAYALAGVLAGFYTLIKLSLGLGALMTLASGCLVVWRPRLAAYRSAVTILAATGGFLIAWLACGGTLAGVRPYLTTGWEVSKGYSSAMSLEADRGWIEAASFLVWFLLITTWVVRQPSLRNRLALAGLLVPLFVAWKHAMVRQDEHVAILARFGIFVMAILLAEGLPAWRWRGTLPAVALLLVPLAVPWTITATRPFYAVTAPDMVTSPLAFRGLRDLARLSHLAEYRERVAQVSQVALRAVELPQSMRTTIGRATVDVYPWDTSYVAANGLSWDNRPFPSSFNVYTPALDAADAAFFESPRRPEYLIWHAGFVDGERSIDGRYLLWDEPRTMRAILGGYDIAAADSRVILLRARARPRFAPPRQLGSTTVPWNTWVPVPQADGVLLAAVSIDTSLIMRAVGTVFRDDAVLLSVLFSAREQAIYRAVPGNMGSGLWLSPFAATFSELRSLLEGGSGRRVVAIRFDASSPLLATLSPSLQVSWSQLTPLGAP
ncbi:MAG: hypothetical protein DMD83_16695 [Candidatus Rokuibacteriota bacterium]|nr:MAG: hypothetical protein DMD83_16695 [Candidatus Rokubacteria bacterium]